MKEENRMSAIVADSIDKIDDSVFKTPFLPSKKGNCKKNENRNNGHLDEISQEENNVNIKKEINDSERNDILLDPFYNHKCPHTDSFIKKTWPDLSGSTVGDCEDLVMEIIIDDFSMLLFRNNEEYDEFMKAENNRQAKLEAERKQKEIEAETRRRKEKKKALKKKLKLEKKLKKKKLEIEHGVQSVPLSSEQKAERKRIKRELKEKKREERRLLRHQNKNAGVDVGNKKKNKGSSSPPVLLNSNVPSTSNITNLDYKHMQSPRTNDGYSLLVSNNMKRPSSTFVDSGILSGSPVTKLPKLEVDDDKSSMLGVAIKTTEVNLNKIPATPPSANVANGHSRTPTASMDIKSSLSNANTIQNNISISTPQTPLSSKQGMITPGVQTTQGVNNDAMLMEILKANPGFATILPNSAGLHGNLQNTSLSSNQSQHLLNLQQILHHHQALANTAAQRGISNANPSGLFQQQIQMAPSQFMPNISIQNNVGNSSINGMNGQITSSGLSTPSRPPQPANGSQVINKSHCNFSDAHLKICMEINNIKPNPTSNEIPNTTTITSTPISTNSITSISNISSSIGDNKQQTTSVLSNTSTMPGITTGIAPSASNMLPTPGKSVNNVMPTNSNTQNNLTSQQAAMIQAMNAQLQANNGKLNVGNQKPQPVMPGGSVFFNTPPGAGIPNTSVNHQPSLSNSNEVALQQAMMQAVLQANGNIPQIQQQNPILAAQIMALQQQQQNQATNMFLQNVVNAQNSNAANLLGGNNNPMSNNLTTNGDPNKSMLNSKNLLLAQSNEQKQKLMSICTNEILKCTQQMQHYQNLYNTLQIPADKEAAKVEYMKHAAIQAEMNVTLMNIKNQLNTSSQQENLINAQQHQLQAAAMAANNNVRSQLPNNLNIPSSLINNMPVDQFYEMQRQAVAQQHFLRQCQNAAGLQQQYQQQNQINAAVAAVAQNASMFQNQYAQSQLLQMQQLLSAQHQMFKQPNNGNGGAPHNIEQLNRQRSATISGEGPNQNQNGVRHQ